MNRVLTTAQVREIIDLARASRATTREASKVFYDVSRPKAEWSAAREADDAAYEAFVEYLYGLMIVRPESTVTVGVIGDRPGES